MRNSILDSLFIKYNLNSEDTYNLKKIINPIINHYEFQRRLTDEYLHHSDITLGEHILEDSVLTYVLARKYDNIRVDLAVKIALLHDLYTIPWQNNREAKVKHFCNKHGFRHPVEAVINSIMWYPELFKNMNDSEIIIDGIIHHMFPLPVRVISYQNISEAELKNSDSFNKIPKKYQELLINSLKRKVIGPFSFSRSKYLEGRIMSSADKKVSRNQIKNFSSAKALVTGHNKSIKK